MDSVTLIGIDLGKHSFHLHGQDKQGRGLLTIPGIGPITASVLAAEMGDGKQYGCSRDFAASLGLVPRQYSTGGKANLLGISKRGDKNIRRLLVQCARALMQRVDKRSDQLGVWIRTMLNDTPMSSPARWPTSSPGLPGPLWPATRYLK